MERESVTPCAGCTDREPSGASAGGIGRRTFLAQGAMLAALAALAACGGGSSSTAPTFSGKSTINVSDYPALGSVGGVAMVNVSGTPMAVVRTDASTFVALSRICPHQGSIVNYTGNGFLCPNHGAQFSKTGTWVGGQPTGNMYTYATSFDATTGTLTIG